MNKKIQTLIITLKKIKKIAQVEEDLEDIARWETGDSDTRILG